MTDMLDVMNDVRQARQARATLDACIILRSKVNMFRPVPALGDCILMNAALHLEGRTPHDRAAWCANNRCLS